MNWRDRALCAQVGGDWWFPEASKKAPEAKAICQACPVRAECLAYALDAGETEGIWAGYSGRELRRLRHDRESLPDDPRLDVVAARTEAGWSAEEIAAELGVTSRTVVRMRARLRDAA